MSKIPVPFQAKEPVVSAIDFKLGNIEPNEQYNIKLNDDIEVGEVTANSFNLVYIRRTVSNTPFYFKIVITLKIVITDLSKLNINGESVSEFANRTKKLIATQFGLPTIASLLIANITRECGRAFITAPTIIPSSLK